MAKSIYITTTEANSEKSLITLGMMKLLIKKFDKVGFFRPIIHGKKTNQKEKAISKIIHQLKTVEKANISYDDTFAYTKEEAYELISQGNVEKMMEEIISKYKELQKKCDFILCDGTDYEGITSAFELDLNAEVARNLGTPIVIVSTAYNHTNEEVVPALQMAISFFEKNGCDILGAIVNRTTKKQTTPLLQVLSDKIDSNLFFGAMYNDPKLRHGAALLNKSFKENIDSDNLMERIVTYKADWTTYKMFEYNLREKAKKNRQRIVLPEGTDERVLKAAEVLIKRDIVDICVVGNRKEIKNLTDELKVKIADKFIIDPSDFDRIDEYSQKLFELRKHKGMTLEAAKDLLTTDVSYFGTMMVFMNDADGMVSGAAHTTQETIRPALQIIKTSPDSSIVSSILFMCMKKKVLIYGDCAVNPDPSAEELAEIAICSAETAKTFQIEPKVALISYSSGASGKGPDVEKVRSATKLAQSKRPDIDIEGPIQYDAAVDLKVGPSKIPGSKVAGRATVMIFPDLNTGNTTYKAVQREANAEAIGPMLQGLNKPINDLSRGCSVLDVINTTLITAIQASETKKAN